MTSLIAKTIGIAFLVAMFYLMLFSDSLAGRFVALTVYSLGLGLVAAGLGMNFGEKKARTDDAKKAIEDFIERAEKRA